MNKTNSEIHRERARRMAEADIYYGLKPSLAEKGIRDGSAMADWYWERRRELKEQPRQPLKEVPDDE